MHPPHVKQAALALIAAGHNDCDVARRLGIARTTVRDWRRPSYFPQQAVSSEVCPRCWRAAKAIRFTVEDYSELLGLYLGDGSISRHARTHRLRIALDLKYPVIVEETRRLLARCFPENAVDVIRANLKGNCVNVAVYSRHLPCVFPQHGRGPKHGRRILLEPWQQTLVDQAPFAFLRGCIRSDGCAFIDRTGRYEYLSYDFSNRSADIVDLFCAACNRVGVDYCRTFWERRRIWDVRINRRASVEIMQASVGLKT